MSIESILLIDQRQTRHCDLGGEEALQGEYRIGRKTLLDSGGQGMEIGERDSFTDTFLQIYAASAVAPNPDG